MSCDDDEFLPARSIYTFYRGDGHSMTFAFEQMVDPDADPSDPLTVWEPRPVTGTIVAQVRAHDTENPDVWATYTIDATDAAVSGEVTVSLSGTQMALAEIGCTYYADLQVTPSGGEPETLAAWEFEIAPDVSRAT